jgi:hypothetical protein
MSPIAISLGKQLRNRLREFAWIDQWFVAFRRGPAVGDGANINLSELRFLFPPKDRFWADPFPVAAPDGGHCIFVEEYVYRSQKGHIAVLSLDCDGNLQSCEQAIVTGHHLSYPFLFRWRDELFMVPESMQSHVVQAYRATNFPQEWEPAAVLLQNVSAVDATLVEIDGHWWMFANIAADGTEDRPAWNTHLYIFHAPAPLGPWTPHARNPVKSDLCGSRPAGALIHSKAGLYRPAQDCSGRYGGAIVVHRISRLTPTEFEEIPVARITPDWAPAVIATHTINSIPGLTVVDGRMRRFRHF